MPSPQKTVVFGWSKAPADKPGKWIRLRSMTFASVCVIVACTYAHISMHGKGWTGAHVPETAVLATEAFSGLPSSPNSSVTPAPSSSFQMNMIMIRSYRTI